MKNENLKTILDKIAVNNSEPDAVFSALMPALAGALECDRTFLYLRYPDTRMGKVPFCWCRSADIPTVLDVDWKEEPKSLPDEDPMFAAALRTAPSIFVEDVETASPDVLNKDFEQKNFGHRALIHAHICHDGQLWGVLQPSMFGKPRVWTDEERSLIATIVEKITPLAVSYVKEAISS